MITCNGLQDNVTNITMGKRNSNFFPNGHDVYEGNLISLHGYF